MTASKLRQAFVLLLALAFGVLGDGDFKGFLDDGCDDWHIYEGEQNKGVMATYCDDKACDIKSWTEFELNWFLGNRDGVLSFGDAGDANFSQSCDNLTVDGPMLRAKCFNLSADHIAVDAKIDINAYIGNFWGYLNFEGKFDLGYSHNWPCKGADWRPPAFPDVNVTEFPMPPDSGWIEAGVISNHCNKTAATPGAQRTDSAAGPCRWDDSLAPRWILASTSTSECTRVTTPLAAIARIVRDGLGIFLEGF